MDLACGEGYGSSFMADVALSVVGVDISDEAVQNALATYIKPNLSYQQGSAIALDFADASFDVVVSFETIEHLAEQAEMLAEIKRVLRPNGLLVISSPNRPIYSEESGEHNEYHVKELDFKEFDDLLKAQFQTVQYFGQRMLMGSVIQSLDGGQSNFRAWHDDGKDIKPNTGHLAEPVYFVAICGASVGNLPSIDDSFIYPDKLDLIKHYIGFAKWAKTLDQELTECSEWAQTLGRESKERDAVIAKLQGELLERTEWAQTLGRESKELDAIISKLQGELLERTEWAQALVQESKERDAVIIKQQAEFIERTEWALSLDATLKQREELIHKLQSELSKQI